MPGVLVDFKDIKMGTDKQNMLSNSSAEQRENEMQITSFG
jgi:hypothetical protein